MSLVSVYCQFDPLEEVWLGDCYPAEFYHDYKPAVKDVFERLTDITRTDLDKLHTTLTSLGVRVRRPVFTNNVNDYLDANGNLLKPPIAPRDNEMALANNFYHLRSPFKIDPWQSAIDEYAASGAHVILAQFIEPFGCIIPASVVRVGKDLYIDYDSHAHSWHIIEQYVLPTWRQDFNVHVCHTDGHADGVFCAVGTGRILTSHWKHDYSSEFPGWDVFHLAYQKSKYESQLNRLNLTKNKNWWAEGFVQQYPAFNQHIEEYAVDWIGYATETVYEVNALMVNEHLILTTGIPSIDTQEWFKKHKVEWIPIEFRARGFWDSGIHCLTVDVRRQGSNRKIVSCE